MSNLFSEIEKQKCDCEQKEINEDSFEMLPFMNMTYPPYKFFKCKKCGKIIRGEKIIGSKKYIKVKEDDN